METAAQAVKPPLGLLHEIGPPPQLHGLVGKALPLLVQEGEEEGAQGRPLQPLLVPQLLRPGDISIM